jgi:2-amino-4-hydroxy-6-hydroxymethyldihydropteridine diphosphokinase
MLAESLAESPMPTSLLGLGSNLGEREATLRAALDEIDALPNVRVDRSSRFFPSRPVGGEADQGEFLNAAAVVNTTVPALPFLELLRRIETRHGRVATTRWAARTLDIDLLLYGDSVIESAMLTVPHMRMSFRPFVLEPAAEIAPKMIHPTIGWPIERLLLHLIAAKDEAVLLSPSESLRAELAEVVVKRCGATSIERPTFKTADRLWPPTYATWLALNPPTKSRTPAATSGGLPYAAAAFPKLTILLDADGDAPGAAKSEWSRIVRQPGRGPSLRLQTAETATVQAEVFAAMESVWPDLGPTIGNRLECMDGHADPPHNHIQQ